MKFRPIRVQGAHAVAATLTDSWASVPFGPVRGYMLEHGVAHLVAAGRVPRAAELLTTFEWAQARTAELPTATLLALVTDYAGTAARLVGKAQAQVEPWRDFFADNAMMPSMVSAVRSLLRRRARMAILIVAKILMKG